MCMCAVELEQLLKRFQPIRANKTARGILSPIQVKDLQFAYALA